MNKKKLFILLALPQLLLLSACGNSAVTEDDEGIPPMTASAGYGFLETTAGRQPTVTAPTEGVSLPDMTGTELATTYTDEYGNVYGVTTPADLPDPVISNDGTGYVITDSEYDLSGQDLSDFPDIDLSEYYKHTDPANTFSFATQTTVTAASPTFTTTAVTTGEVSTVTAPSLVTTTAGYDDDDWFEDYPEEETTAAAAGVKDDELAASRNAVIPSKYRSGANEVMHTYSYNSLTDTQKYVYDVITAACLDLDDKVTFPLNKKVTFDDLYTAYQMLYLDEVRLYYIDTVMEYVTDRATDYITEMNLTYIYSKADITRMQTEMDNAAAKLLTGVTPNMSEYDAVKHIHDVLIQNCVYTLEGNDITSSYSAIVEKTAQCQGYARAFSYLCNLCGIETDIVLGVANEEHMWNMVKINNKWYHVDLTWDDPDKTDFPDFIRYDYFCVSTDRMLELRTIEGNSHDIPTANSEDLEYYNYNKLVANSLDDAKRIYKEEALRISRDKSSTVQFRCGNSEVYEQVINAFFTGGQPGNVLDMTDEVNKTAVNKFNSNIISHNTNLDTLIVKILLNYE